MLSFFEAFIGSQVDVCANDLACGAALAPRLGPEISTIPHHRGANAAPLASAKINLWPNHQGSAIVIGSDSPTLPMSLVAEAVERLNRADVVLGPATDGGVYLIGIRSETFAFRELFNDVEWSTSRVCDQLCRQATLIGASLELLPPWFDVDEPEDLERLAVELRDRSLTNSPATRAELANL